MRLLSISLLPLALAAIAPRDISFGGSLDVSSDVTVVVDAVTSCSTQVQTCDGAVLSLGISGEVDFSGLESLFATLISTFDTACTTIKSAGTLVIEDLLALMSCLQPLQTACGQLISDLIFKKGIIAGLDQCSGVSEFGSQFQSVAAALLEAVLGLLPGPLDEIAKFAIELGESLEKGIWAFGDGNCTSSGTGHQHVSEPAGPYATSAVDGMYPTAAQSDADAGSVTVTGTYLVAPSPSATDCSTDEPLATATYPLTSLPATVSTYIPILTSTSTLTPSPRPTVVTAGVPSAASQSSFAVVVAMALIGLLL